MVARVTSWTYKITQESNLNLILSRPDLKKVVYGMAEF